MNCLTPFGISNSFFGGVGILAVFVLNHLISKLSENALVINLALGAVIAGGIYNALYRLLGFCVSDYLKWGTVNFNIADVYVCVGLITMFCYTLYTNGRTTKKTHNPNN